MRQKLLDGLATILEAPVTEESVLDEVGSWDSLSVVSTIALFDDCGCPEVDGQALAACVTVADVLRLAGVEVPA